MNEGTWYDRYWRRRAGSRTAARSRARARIAARLLGRRGGRVLDLGCGPGYAAEEFARLGFRVVGLDISPEAVRAARARGIEARRFDITREPIPREFDAIVCLEVLEHLVDPVAALRRVLEAIGARGEAVISLPNEFHIVGRMGVLLGRPTFGGHDDPHVRHFSPRTARRLIREAGGTVVAWRPVSFLPRALGSFARTADALARLVPGLLAMSLLFRVRRAAP